MITVDLYDITEEEWAKYEWLEIGPGIFIRGIEKVAPPNDGYHYIEITKFGDTKQVWVRAQTYDR